MAEYNAPLRDMRFVLHEVFDAPKLWARLPALAETVDVDTADAILEEAAKVTGQLIAPLNRSGDEEGAQWNDGVVTTPAGFKEAYQTYIEGGWVGLGGNPEFNGMGMPKMLSVQFEEMLYSANSSFALYSALSSGACLAIDAHASQELKEKLAQAMHTSNLFFDEKQVVNSISQALKSRDDQIEQLKNKLQSSLSNSQNNINTNDSKTFDINKDVNKSMPIQKLY